MCPDNALLQTRMVLALVTTALQGATVHCTVLWTSFYAFIAVRYSVGPAATCSEQQPDVRDYRCVVSYLSSIPTRTRVLTCDWNTPGEEWERDTDLVWFQM